MTNMPGAVGRTSTYAFCNVTLPYVLQLVKHGWRNLAAADPGIAEGSQHRPGPGDQPGRCLYLRLAVSSARLTAGVRGRAGRRPDVDRDIQRPSGQNE